MGLVAASNAGCITRPVLALALISFLVLGCQDETPNAQEIGVSDA